MGSGIPEINLSTISSCDLAQTRFAEGHSEDTQLWLYYEGYRGGIQGESANEILSGLMKGDQSNVYLIGREDGIGDRDGWSS